MIKDFIRDKIFGFSIEAKNRHFIISSIFDTAQFNIAKFIFQKGDLLSLEELIKIGQLVEEANKLQGDIAEVGVYRGSSALMIAENKINKQLLLFDTFKGLPEKSESDEEIKDLSKGNFACWLSTVQERLKDFKDIEYYQGLFPQETGKAIKGRAFSFVHLDVDLYQPTADSLELFWKQLVPKGMILIHDYPNLKGIKKAVDSFAMDNNPIKLQISGNQVLLIKQ
jgi:O-methyltransferase